MSQSAAAKREYHRKVMARIRQRQREQRTTFGVCERVCEPHEPAWIVYEGCGNAEARAMFYREDDARDYTRFLLAQH